MAVTLKTPDRVRETTTTTGTGDLTLAGAPLGYQTFDAAVGAGNLCLYAIVHQTAAEWETGIGTLSDATTLARTTPQKSSNGNAAVNFSAGTKDVFVGAIADFYQPNDGPLAGFRNALINGGFEVWQRGTGSTSCAAGSRTFLADRWYVNPSGANITQQRSTTVPSGARARYSLQLDGAASVTTVLIGQRIEAANIPAIKRRVVFSALVYNGSGAAFAPSLLLGTPGAADDFTTVTNRLTQALQSCADAAWTRVEHTADISGYTNIDNGIQAEMQIPSGSLVASDTVRVTEIQLEPGYARTPFEGRTAAAETALCARYFRTISAAPGVAVNATTMQLMISHPGMRAAPTPSATAALTVTDHTSSDFTQSAADISIVNGNDANGGRYGAANFSGMTGGKFSSLIPGGGAVQLSAEL